MPNTTAIFVIILSLMVPLRNAMAEKLPNAFDCHFKQGGAWTHEDGKYLEEKVKELDLYIRNANAGAGNAMLKTDNGSAKLKHVAALDANHYLEVTVGGYLNITTIFDQSSKDGGYPAVHSRHFGVLGKPIISQYRGICRTAK